MRSTTISTIIVVSSTLFLRIMYVCSITCSTVLCSITILYACVLSRGDNCFCYITCQSLLCLCVLYLYIPSVQVLISYHIIVRNVTCCVMSNAVMLCSVVWRVLICRSLVLYYHSIMSFVLGECITVFHIVLCTYS